MNKQYTVLPLDGAKCFTLKQCYKHTLQTESPFEIQFKLKLESYFIFVGNIHLSFDIMGI